jgi:hypothetical protein
MGFLGDVVSSAVKGIIAPATAVIDAGKNLKNGNIKGVFMAPIKSAIGVHQASTHACQPVIGYVAAGVAGYYTGGNPAAMAAAKMLAEKVGQENCKLSDNLAGKVSGGSSNPAVAQNNPNMFAAANDGVNGYYTNNGVNEYYTNSGVSGYNGTYGSRPSVFGNYYLNNGASGYNGTYGSRPSVFGNYYLNTPNHQHHHPHHHHSNTLRAHSDGHHHPNFIHMG